MHNIKSIVDFALKVKGFTYPLYASQKEKLGLHTEFFPFPMNDAHRRK